MAYCEALVKGLSKVSLTDGPQRQSPEKKITNAHDDDIHGLQMLDSSVSGDGQLRFLSGSKDGEVKMWSSEGRMIREMLASERPRRDSYCRWITALSSCGEKFQAGTRNGVLLSWVKDAESEAIGFRKIGDFRIDPLVIDGRRAAAKERNQCRINCIFPISRLSPKNRHLQNLIFLGQPRGVSIFDTATSRVVSSQILHGNDWTYCIVPLSCHSVDSPLLAMVIGSALEIHSFDVAEKTLSKQSEVWSCHSVSSNAGQIRPHIASLVKMEESTLLVGGCFDGCVRCFDPDRKCCSSELKGHTGRVWDVLSLSPSLVASGADDRTVHMWDIRCQPRDSLIWKSVPLVGRASSLLRISEFGLVCGSCADDPASSPDKGCLYFFDIRHKK